MGYTKASEWAAREGGAGTIILADILTCADTSMPRFGRSSSEWARREEQADFMRQESTRGVSCESSV